MARDAEVCEEQPRINDDARTGYIQLQKARSALNGETGSQRRAEEERLQRPADDTRESRLRRRIAPARRPALK
jgi:hypothetical protein